MFIKKHNLVKPLIIIGLLMLLILSCVKKDNAPKTEELILYANITSIEQILDDFEMETGIKVKYHRISTTDYLDTVMRESEIDSLKADIFQAPIIILDQLSNKNLLAPYTSTAALHYPDWAKRESEGIYKFAIEYVGILYNSSFLNPEEIPQKYQDLIDQKWRGKLVMPNPATHPTTISWLVALKEHIFSDNEDEWESFIKALAENNPLFVDSFTPTVSVILNGERPIGISMPKYIITNKDSALDYAKIEPMLGSLRGIGISSETKNPEAARKFIDFWLSEAVGEYLANEVGEYVLTPNVFPPIDGIEYISVIPIKELPEEEITRWGAYFKKIFTL